MIFKPSQVCFVAFLLLAQGYAVATPNSYHHLIQKAAQKHSIDPALIQAVIKQESAYNRYAVSPAGAQGLMQLMPDTAKRFRVKNAFIPAQNINAGSQYLAWLLKRFKGNKRFALAGYNAGEGKVDRYKGIPPYRETRKYVRKVMGYYRGFKSKQSNQTSIRRISRNHVVKQRQSIQFIAQRLLAHREPVTTISMAVASNSILKISHNSNGKSQLISQPRVLLKPYTDVITHFNQQVVKLAKNAKRASRVGVTTQSTSFRFCQIILTLCCWLFTASCRFTTGWLMKKYPVEALLRPAVEFNSAFIALLFAVVLYFAPGLILMTPVVAHSAALLLLVLFVIRFYQGWRIVRYKRGLKKLPYYSMTGDDVPVSHRKLFLGKGFRWRQKHVERLRAIYRDDADKYLSPSLLYRFARWLEIRFEYTPIIKKGIGLLSWNTFFNPVRPLPPVGGSPEIHAVGMFEGESNIVMDLGERVGHTLVLGTTRVGKTRLAELLITQDIRRGDVTIVFDPKGDADLMRRVYGEAIQAGRPVYVFHLGFPDISARYNPVGEFSRITEVAGRIADQLPSEGNSAAFKMFGWRFVNIVAQALVKLGEQPDYPKISRHILSIDHLFVRYAHAVLSELASEGWSVQVQIIQDNLDEKTLPFALKGRDHGAIALMHYIEKSDLYDAVLDGLMGAFRYDKTYFDKIVSSLAPLLEQLTSGRTAELLAPEYYDITDHRPIFDWKSVIQRKAVVYVGLDCLSDAVVGGAIGASMFADLTSVAGYLYKHGLDYGQARISDKKTGKIIRNALPKIALHADEFNEIVGDQFIPMLNKAGGAGFQVTAYTQTAADILAGIGNEAKAGQIEGNFNTLIMLRVKTKKTAKFFLVAKWNLATRQAV